MDTLDYIAWITGLFILFLIFLLMVVVPPLLDEACQDIGYERYEVRAGESFCVTGNTYEAVEDCRKVFSFKPKFCSITLKKYEN